MPLLLTHLHPAKRSAAPATLVLASQLPWCARKHVLCCCTPASLRSLSLFSLRAARPNEQSLTRPKSDHEEHEEHEEHEDHGGDIMKIKGAKDSIDEATFEQILEMDDDEDEREFSKSIVYDFFTQAESTFEKMDANL